MNFQIDSIIQEESRGILRTVKAHSPRLGGINNVYCEISVFVSIAMKPSC